MGRYARALYSGTGSAHARYGIDLRSEHSVEPMHATLEVDTNADRDRFRSGNSSFTDVHGRSVYDRVQISWLNPLDVTRSVLLRSNTGYPTGPSDPYSKILIDSENPDLPSPVAVRRLPEDPYDRPRSAYIDNSVEQGREYFYSMWTMTGSVEDETDVWHLSGRAMVTVSSDHKILETLKGALPPYMWNRYSGPNSGVAVLEEPDDENTITRWLQASAWELDKVLTKADLVRQIWDTNYTPAVLLDEAVEMFGLPNEPSLGTRAARTLLANAATITGERGTLNSISLLVEALSGFSCDISVGTNLLPNTDESSFEGLMVDDDNNVTGGTGRWFIEGADLTRIPGDEQNSDTRIARDPNPDEYVAPGQRFGLGLTPTNPSGRIHMDLGERIRVKRITSGTRKGVIETAWPHGLEDGDVVTLRWNGNDRSIAVREVDGFRVQFDVDGSSMENLDDTPDDSYLSGGPIPAYQGIPVTAGSNYVFTGMFQAPNTDDINLTLNYWDLHGNSLGSNTAQPEDLVTPSDWNLVSSFGPTPEGTYSVTLQIEGIFAGIDSLMVRQGGARYSDERDYDTDTPYDGGVDYTFEDAQLLTLRFDISQTPSGGTVPGVPPEFTIRADMHDVLRSRLTDILTNYLPIGTGFRIEGLAY